MDVKGGFEMRIDKNNATDGVHIAGLAAKHSRTNSGDGNGRVKSDKKNITSVSASDLTINKQDSITMRNVKAQKDALKTVINQYTSDKMVTDGLEARRQHIRELDADIATSQKEISRIQNQKKQIKETSGVADDSEEQKNLELLEKKNESLKPRSKVVLTKEENEKLAKMGPPTEYQTAALAFDKEISSWDKKIEEAQKTIAAENSIIEGTKKNLLSIHPMVDAQGDAEKIKKQANEDIIGMLVSDAKKKTDEKQDKIEKEADKKADETAEQEKIREKIKEKTDEMNKMQEKSKSSEKVNASENVTTTDNLSQIQKNDSDQKQIQAELMTLVANQKLIDDDTKGIVVDQQA